MLAWGHQHIKLCWIFGKSQTLFKHVRRTIWYLRLLHMHIGVFLAHQPLKVLDNTCLIHPFTHTISHWWHRLLHARCQLLIKSNTAPPFQSTHSDAKLTHRHTHKHPWRVISVSITWATATTIKGTSSCFIYYRGIQEDTVCFSLLVFSSKQSW